MVTVSELEATVPSTIHAAALAWLALADDLDSAYERYAPVQRRVAESGSGAAVGGAVRQVEGQCLEVNGTYMPARMIGLALQACASEIVAVHAFFLPALAAARHHSLSVDDMSGAVTVPYGPVPHQGDAQNVAEIETALVSALRRARRVDAQTTKVLKAHIPALMSGFGQTSRQTVDRVSVQSVVGRPPHQVHTWWLGLTPQQQEWVIREYPDLIGPLAGVPVADRDRANRLRLDAILVDPSPDYYELYDVRSKLKTLDDAYLLDFDPDGDGRAVISIGNPDEATHTAVFVPGVGTDLSSVPGGLDRALRIQQAAGSVNPGGSGDVAVVFWLGYDPPDWFVDADRQDASEAGGAALTPFLNALPVTHAPDVPGQHITVVAHSYGSTVIAESLLHGPTAADDVIVLGSPGMHAGNAAALHHDPRHLWVGVGTSDDIIEYVPDWVAHGPHPHTPGFGANRIIIDTAEHSDYWNEGSDSLLQQAHIITGQYERVKLEHGELPI